MPSERALAPFKALFPSPSPQLQTVIAYLCGVADQDLELTLAQLTDDHVYEWIARGFDHLGPRVKDRKTTEEFFRNMYGKFLVDYRYEIKDYLEMPGKIMFQVHCVAGLTIDGGMTNKTYENDYVWIFHLTDDKEKPKIKVAKEFFDSLYSFEFWKNAVPPSE